MASWARFAKRCLRRWAEVRSSGPELGAPSDPRNASTAPKWSRAVREGADAYGTLADPLHDEPDVAQTIIQSARRKQDLVDGDGCPHWGKPLDSRAALSRASIVPQHPPLAAAELWLPLLSKCADPLAHVVGATGDFLVASLESEKAVEA
jgi:hypothetical protein